MFEKLFFPLQYNALLPIKNTKFYENGIIQIFPPIQELGHAWLVNKQGVHCAFFLFLHQAFYMLLGFFLI